MLTHTNKSIRKILLLTGELFVLLAQVPYLILGIDSIIPYHDQLDGELIAYIYQAKYLFSGQNIIPEFLNGASKTALYPPSFLGVLFFRFLSPFAAYLLLQLIGQMTAYAGMFFMAEVLTKNCLTAAVAAILYAFLPFLPVYGLSQYGIPLLLFCIYLLYRGKYKIPALCYVAFYSIMSSLVLCGFACILLWTVVIVRLAAQKRLREHLWTLWGLALMTVIYLLENLPLAAQILRISQSWLSHKSEYQFASSPFGASLLDYLLHNAEHSQDAHEGILCLSFTIIILLLLFRKKISDEVRRLGRLMLAGVALIFIICAIAALWGSSFGIMLKTRFGALGAFQLNRVLWLAPALWYSELALSLQVLWSVRGRLGKYILLTASFLFLGWMSLVSLKNSLVKPCIQQILTDDYKAISWSDYFAVGVLEQVECFIEETEGMNKTEYKVASLGIDPAAALYHGFYCVDGYSNNYDLEYKHAFRAVIAPELAQNDWLRSYFDDWGNRCYLYSAETAGYYTIEKESFWYNNLQIDTDALKSLGCSYILSAAYVVNAEEENLALLREDPFVTEDSYYRIFLYKIK